MVALVVLDPSPRDAAASLKALSAGVRLKPELPVVAVVVDVRPRVAVLEGLDQHAGVVAVAVWPNLSPRLGQVGQASVSAHDDAVPLLHEPLDEPDLARLQLVAVLRVLGEEHFVVAGVV